MPPERYEGQTLTIYFPTKEEYDLILKRAEKAQIKHSHFAREMIRLGMEQSSREPDINLLHESAKSREELTGLRQDLKDKNATIEKLQTELFALKQSLFLQPMPTGQGQLSSELVDLLQDGRTWRSNDIMAALHIDSKNIDAIKVLAGQLHALQDLRLVVEGPKGWRWVG